jgi:hypothetical protein
MENQYKFKKNESFYIRDGWFEKAINSINELDINIFYKNEGMKILGIGSNMIKSLKYWLFASNIIKQVGKKIELSEFGSLILKYDKYLEKNFTWFLIHYFLVRNVFECPIFCGIFNFDMKQFTKNEAVDEFVFSFDNQGVPYKKEYIEDDLNVFIKSYYNDNITDNPEDNYLCPLSGLKLIEKKNEKFVKVRPAYSSLSYLLVYYILQELYDNKPFVIEDSMYENNSPVAVFNLDKNMYLQYLDEMKKNGLVTINKTAGLNTVYFEAKLSLSEIFDKYFGGEYV